jgi:hypothetical protein
MRVDVSGRLTQSDYDQLIPSWEAFITRHGRYGYFLLCMIFMDGIRRLPGTISALVSNTRGA